MKKSEYIKQNYGKIPLRDIATKCKCSISTIVNYARRLNIPFITKSTHQYLKQIKPLLNISGIYRILNQNNQKIYIGYSCNIGRRFKEHLKFLFRNKHKNKELQEDYNNGHILLIELLYQDKDTILLAQKEQELISEIPLINRYNKLIESKEHNHISSNSITKFYKKIAKQNGCWLWQGKVDKDRYGKFGYWDTNLKKGISIRAHRFSYIISKGQIPAGLKVCHTCDNRLCVNPTHLFLGSDKINAIDRESKNKGRKTKFDYDKIIQLKKEGKSNKDIAQIIGCSPSHITYILKHKVKSCHPNS